MQSEAGATYTLKFDGEGVVTYACAPHEAAGMKGAVVVGDPAPAGAGVDLLEPALLGLAGTILAAPFVAAHLLGRRHREENSPRPPAGRGGPR